MSGSILAKKLEDVWRECQDSEQLFPHRRILHIGSESFDAQAATVFQGLDALGFEVCTIGKPNINSWSYNKVIADPAKFKFDFILSALHWGTRFSHFRRFGLAGYPKVLIDGDDSIVNDTWRTKYNRYVERYVYNPPDKVKDTESPPYRWMDTLDGYEPDVVFTLAAERRQGNHYYIPKGIRDQWLATGLNKNTQSRTIDFAHIPGPGTWREAMRNLLDLGVLPGNIYNAKARGEPVYPEKVRALAEKDNSINIHSYYRWACHPDYFRVLNDAKVLIHPGIDHFPFWEAPRIYEGWACGCLVAMSKPTVDVSEYPPTGVCPEAMFVSHDELIDKAHFWHAHPEHMDTLRERSAKRAHKYFIPASVTRYFLQRVHDAILS